MLEYGGQVAACVLVVAAFNLVLYALNENSRPWRLLRCSRPLLLISNRKPQPVESWGPVAAAAAVAAQLGPDMQHQPRAWLAWDLVDATHLYTGMFGTPVLTFFRAVEAALFVFTLAYGSAKYGVPSAPSFFVYFTNWTFLLFGATGLLGAALTARVWHRQRRPSIPLVGAAMPARAPAPAWGLADRAYHLSLVTACAASVMLTVYYWVADYVQGSPVRVDNPLKHGASAALLLLDVFLSRAPMVSYHLQVVIGYGSAYLVFLWVHWAATGTWVYRSLDWSKPYAAVYYAALPTLLIFAFFLMFLVAVLRELALSSTCCGRCCECCCGDACQVEAQAVVRGSSARAKPLSSQLSTQLVAAAPPEAQGMKPQ